MRTQLNRDQRAFIADQYLARNIGRPAQSWALLPECLSETDVGQAMERRVNRISNNKPEEVEANKDNAVLAVTVLSLLFTLGIVCGIFGTLIVGKL
jgi:hypothetical protein